MKKIFIFITIILLIFFGMISHAAAINKNYISEDKDIQIKIKLKKDENLEAQEINITFEIINDSEKEANLVFNSSQKYDFYLFSSEIDFSDPIKNVDDLAIYKWSDDKMFKQSFQEINIPKKQKIVYDIKLEPKNITKDKYILIGELLSTNYKIKSEQIEIFFK